MIKKKIEYGSIKYKIYNLEKQKKHDFTIFSVMINFIKKNKI